MGYANLKKLRTLSGNLFTSTINFLTLTLTITLWATFSHKAPPGSKTAVSSTERLLAVTGATWSETRASILQLA